MKETIKKGIIFGISSGLTLLIFGISYATWTNLSQETDGQPLTAAKWNTVIDRLNLINEKSLATAWVNFDGTNCTTNGNECLIRDSYNVSKVVRLNIGQYEIYFNSLMTNSNYSAVANTTRNPHSFSVPIRIAQAHTFLTNKLSIVSGYLDTNSNYIGEDASYISLNINGGK